LSAAVALAVEPPLVVLMALVLAVPVAGRQLKL
jgi:hypothetical protein